MNFKQVSYTSPNTYKFKCMDCGYIKTVIFED